MSHEVYSEPTHENFMLLVAPTSQLKGQVLALYEEGMHIKPSFLLRWKNPYTPLYNNVRELVSTHVRNRLSPLRNGYNWATLKQHINYHNAFALTSHEHYQRYLMLLNELPPIFLGTELRYPLSSHVFSRTDAEPDSNYQAIYRFLDQWFSCANTNDSRLIDLIIDSILGEDEHIKFVKLAA